MPLTKISVQKRLPITQARALAAAVQDALVKTCNAPEDDLFQLISRFEVDEMILHPSYGSVTRSGDACVVEIVYLAGRTDDQKRALFAHIAQAALRVGYRADDVMVALIENTRMDWSLGKGVAYADLHANLCAALQAKPVNA